MRTTRQWRPAVEVLEDRTVPSAGQADATLGMLLAHLPHHHHTVHHHGGKQHHTSPGGTTPGSTPGGQGAPGPTQTGLPLSGQITGEWDTVFTVPDVGGRQELTGTGTVTPLGVVWVSGELHTPGFIAQGQAGGTLTLTGPNGSVTLQLLGPIEPGFGGVPSTFQYTITAGTGAYAGNSGTGTLSFQEQPPIPIDCPPNAMCAEPITVPGSFTLTFQPAG